MNTLISTVSDAVTTVKEVVDTYPVLSCIIISFLSLYIIYTQILFKNRSRKQGQFKGNHKGTDPRFVQKRLQHYPPPYPNGWWKLCDVCDLDNGNIVSVSALGLDLCVFRGKNNGKIGVVDAHCPHLGAHLGFGAVVGDCLQCPFHGWEFQPTGECTNIPSAGPNAPIPSSAKARSHIHTVYRDMVFLWFHAEGEPPQWGLLPLDHLKDFHRFSARAYEYTMHITDMQENAADYFHFNFLHVPMTLPILKWFMTMRYETELFFEEEPGKENWCYFINISICKFFGIEFPFYKQKTRVILDGPGILHFDVKTPLGNMWMVKSVLPREPFRQYVEDVWYCDKRTPRFLAHLIAMTAAGALEQDRAMWENRVYLKKPILVKGDGPFLKYRRWFDQFFSESSAEWAKNGQFRVDNW